MAIPKWQDVGVSFAGSTGSMANARRGIADAARLAYGISDRIQKQADTEAALERQKVLQGREDALWNRQQQEQQTMDIYNKNQTPQQLAAATLAVGQDKGARDRVDALSFTPEELKLIEGETYVDEQGLKRSKNTYKDEADLERSLLARGVDPLTARAIRDKAQLQRTLGEEVNKVAPTYESEIMARQHAYEQAVKAGGGVVPAAMAADLRSARAADEQVRISKREALLKQIESVDKEMRKSELAAAKEGVRVDEKSGGGSSGKSKTLMGRPEVGIEKFADELKKEVSNFGIGMDATKVKTAVTKMKALGFSEDEQKYVLSNLTRDGSLETYVMDPTDEQIVELGRAYDNAVAKGGGNLAYTRALQDDVADLQATKQSLMNQLKAVDADPMAARIANARAAILGVGEVPKVAPTRAEADAPKTEVKKPSVTKADVFEQMTPAQQAEAEKQSLITGTKWQFDELYNKPDKTEEDWKTLEELGKELDVLTGRVSSYVPATEQVLSLEQLAEMFDQAEAAKQQEKQDALAQRLATTEEVPWIDRNLVEMVQGVFGDAPRREVRTPKPEALAWTEGGRLPTPEEQALRDTSIEMVPLVKLGQGLLSASSPALRQVGAQLSKPITNIKDARATQRMIKEAMEQTTNLREINRLREAHRQLVQQMARSRF